MVQVGLLFIGAYLLGSLPTAYIVGRVVKGVDLRRYGSGNLGGSNAGMLMGRWALVGVGLVDAMKALIAVLVSRLMGLDLGVQCIVGLIVLIGNAWSLYLRFTGGRGIAATMGVLLGLGRIELFLVFIVLGLLGFTLRNTALWVGISLILLPVVSLVLGRPHEVVLFCCGLAVLLAVKRLAANWEAFPAGLSKRQVLVNRLLHDRDIGPQRDWIFRTPSADDSRRTG